MGVSIILFENAGYQVTAVGTPDEACKASEAFSSIDLLITDVFMPEMNGKVLYQKLQKQFPDLKCLYISGYTSNVITHRGILDKGVGFLQKPFSKDELIQKVQEIVGSS